MPIAVLRIDASPLRELAGRLAAVDGDKGAALHGIGAAWESSTKGRFYSGTTPDGTPWKPSLRAMKKGGGKGTLVLTGQLRDNVQYAVVDDDTVQVGVNKDYGGIHQFGGIIQRAGAHAVPLHLPSGREPSAGIVVMPARPYLGFSADDATNSREILEGFVVAKTGGAA